MKKNKDHHKSRQNAEETAPIDEVEERVQAEMKRVEGSATERAGQGLQDEELERKGRKLKEEGERELKQQQS